MVAEANPQWRGDTAGKASGLHRWVEGRIPKPEVCPKCNQKGLMDLANIRPDKNPETYTRELKNWRWLCRRCHMLEDGRMNNLKQFRNA